MYLTFSPTVINTYSWTDWTHIRILEYSLIAKDNQIFEFYSWGHYAEGVFLSLLSEEKE